MLALENYRPVSSESFYNAGKTHKLGFLLTDPGDMDV
jgi:hypothetical protein